MPKPNDLKDRIFEHWTVLRRWGLTRDKKVIWLCRCDCGAEHPVVGANLVSGGSIQCRACADKFAAAGQPRKAKPKPPRLCDGCGKPFVPKRRTARWCSPECKAKGTWREMAADPARKAAHARRVTEDYKRDTYVDHDACAQCGKPFHGPPSRLHCSRECLDAVIRAGKYSSAFHRRRVAAEAAALAAELQRRLTDGEN